MSSILHVIDSIGIGGAESLLADTIAGLVKIAPDVKQYIYVLNNNSNELKFDINVTRVPIRPLKNYLDAVLVAYQLNRYIKKHRITIVHAHLTNSIIISKIASYVSHVKFFATYHNTSHHSSHPHFSRWRLILDKLLDKSSNTSVCVSQDVASSLKDAGFRSIKWVLPNFSNKELYPIHLNTAFPNSGLRLLMISNLKAIKNIEYPIQEIAAIDPSLGVTLDVCGQGELQLKLQAMIERFNAPVRLLGSTNITSEFMANYDCLLISSHQEGMPISLLEALKCAMPSILADHIASLRETAKDSAWYFSKEQKGSLVRAIHDVLNTDTDSFNLRRNRALVYSQEYSVDVYLSKLMKLYGIF
jgi:glycosyltransferase involved in cell wall biosynthesis